MTPLGKSLTFYLRYAAEMDRLYWQPEVNGTEVVLTGLEDAEGVRRMACAVGEAASNEAAELLAECGRRIEAFFVGLETVTVAKQARPSTIRRGWEWYAMVRGRSAGRGWFQCGVVLRDREKTFVPWLWRRGGRAWEDLVMARLGNRAHSRSGGGVVDSRGSVALPPVPVVVGDSSDAEIDRDALIEQVVGRFTVLTADDIDIIARNVGVEDDAPEPESPDS